MDDSFGDIMLKIFYFLTNRITILFIVFLVMLFIITSRLFNLQIVNGITYDKDANIKKSSKTTDISAQRGEIYDRYGRLLATNEIVHKLMLDPSEVRDDLNMMFYNLVKLLEANGETILVDFKITEEQPREFSAGLSEKQRTRWLLDMGVREENDDPDLAYAQLLEYFKIPEEWTEHEKYMVLALRGTLFRQRYALNIITLSVGVKPETIIFLEENNRDFIGLYIDFNYKRIYPEGQYAAHIIGEIRRISATEFEENEILGYETTDLIGKNGIEQSYELILRGTKGVKTTEISNGKATGTYDITEPVPGNNVFLTLDVELQKKAYHILEDKLAELLVEKMLSSDSRVENITPKMVIASMTDAGTVSTEKIMEASEGAHAYPVKNYVNNKIAETPLEAEDDFVETVRNYITTGIEDGDITVTRMLLIMHEQGVVKMTEDELRLSENGNLDILRFIIGRLQTKEITPQMTNLQPCTGSIVVEDIKTGALLAAVAYPSYDSNELVNEFNEEYWNRVNGGDPTRPLNNRPFSEGRAPGSTFKMITAIAGLENGVITPDEKIYDETEYIKAGLPLRCWSGASHGHLTVAEALEVSCNFFFNEVQYRLGNAKDGTMIEGINKLNNYMSMFGLGEKTGVEIGESSGKLASPATVIRSGNNTWSDSDSIRVAIGQSINSYTAAQMAKYISTLASGGLRYQSHFLKQINSPKGEMISAFEPILEMDLNIPRETLDVVYKGMLQVTGVQTGSGMGTARAVFADFPIAVAGKTGTAQEAGGADHASFGGFAPFDDPKIAVYVLIPRGDVPGTAPAAYVAKSVIEAYFGLDDEPEREEETNVLVR